MKRTIHLVLVIAGIFVGLWHINLAMQAIFVFRENEPLISWVTIASGPLTTLLATIVAIFNKKIGGHWLVISSIVSLTLFIISDMQTAEHTFPYLLWIAVPMATIGTGFITMERYAKPGSDHSIR